MGNRLCADGSPSMPGVVFERLGDRVDYWGTINEPWVISYIGCADGVMAPDWRMSACF
jgi:beta-glucosidase/6-phospho-beta-glucosidase/beta-galactosidase